MKKVSEQKIEGERRAQQIGVVSFLQQERTNTKQKKTNLPII